LPVYSIILAAFAFARDDKPPAALCCQLSHKLLLVYKRTLTGDHFKIFMKACEIIKTAFITKLFDAKIVFDQQFAGISYTQLDQKL